MNITEENLRLLDVSECNSEYYLEKLFAWQDEYDWGISGTDKPLARCQMRKDNRHSDIWKCEYFLNVS